MDAKNAGNLAAHDEGDTDGRRNLVPPLVLTADQMAQVHQAEYLMDVGELERPQADDGTVREENAILRDALHECLAVLNRIANVHGYATAIRAAAQAREALTYSYSKEARADD